ncbi:hypothetical protein GCM10010271_34810 [Streptomyces kurssanovii]|nr:hypothetical protein GCM10010271_34810 [Streptomyces kurssanovii]
MGQPDALAVSLARDRLSINTAGLKDRMGKFVSERPENEEAGASERFTRNLFAGLSYGREVVLAKSPFEEHDFLIADFKRFDDAGAKCLKFSDGHVELARGQRWELVGRWATWAGLERFLQTHAEEYPDKQVVMMPANLTEDPSNAPAALAHGAHCANLAARIEHAGDLTPPVPQAAGFRWAGSCRHHRRRVPLGSVPGTSTTAPERGGPCRSPTTVPGMSTAWT